MSRSGRIKIDKLRKLHYREKYARVPENKIVKWNAKSDVEYMWDQLKRPMIDGTREICGSVRVRRKNLRSACWNDVIAVEKKKAMRGCVRSK